MKAEQCGRAQPMVLDQECFNLDADRFKQFTATLYPPPGPDEDVERLMAVEALWSVDRG